MSNLNGLPEVGDVVYQHYKPQQPGRIVTIFHADAAEEEAYKTLGPEKYSWYGLHIRRRYRVRLMDGTEEQWAGNEVGGSLAGLIADHERKIKTHKKLLKRVLDA